MNREMQNELEPEVLGADEQAVSQMIGGLRKVEAPVNFERRVMSRIAEGAPVSNSAFAVPAWALSVPIVLIILIGTFFVFRSYRQADSEVPLAAVPQEPLQQQDMRPAELPPVTDQAPASQEVVREEPQSVVPTGGRQRSDKSAAPANKNLGGSYDEALPQQKLLRPAGLPDPSSPSSANRAEVITATSISVGEVLSQIGVTAEFNDGWKVARVLPNSIAERSGVKAGDVVVELGDQQLSSDTDFKGSGSISTIRVRRNGKTLSIRLK